MRLDKLGPALAAGQRGRTSRRDLDVMDSLLMLEVVCSAKEFLLALTTLVVLTSLVQ